MIAESESHSFTLSDLTPNTLYQFRVRTVDAFTMGEPSSPSTWVKTPPAAPSETIDGLRWKSLDNNTIFVEWNPVETSHQSGDHLRYRLSWSMEDSDQTEDAKTPERKFLAHHIDTKSPQAIVKLNTSRDCRMLVLSVRPMNDQGAGLISTDTVAFVHRNVEPRHLSFVNASALNSTHALFSWEWEEENECGRAHAIQLSCSSTDNQSHDVTVLAEFSEWILGELNASTKYQCFLTPVDDEGNYGVASKPVTINTKQIPPTDAPIIKKISLKPTNNDVGYTTIIEWSAIEFPHTNWTDTVIGYKIFVYVSETASEAVELTMPISDLSNPRQPSARLDGLKLMYMYTIQVAGYNSGGLGPLSASRTIRLGPRSSLDDDSSSMAYHLHPAWISFIYLVIILRL
ncbi:hypothetical protein DICVIV_01695 [Dictyocaulus viviparus]|uniref:Fibronectin type-III domain-containing protein n=1 Tax=Dictyocaulus viviparus TaxID=29172 RepID=A0A0D8YC15_DICVI|nr:hypothetical protein DICVIV_01695 [Dictyocaulus viviparus]